MVPLDAVLKMAAQKLLLGLAKGQEARTTSVPPRKIVIGERNRRDFKQALVP